MQLDIIGFLHSLTSLDIFIYAANTVIFLVIFRISIMIARLSGNKFLGLTTKPFSRGGTGGRRVLILGDSTAVGTGANSPEDTIAGRLARDYPKAEIVNVAENGGLVRDIETQLELVREQKFDLVIVSAGGNDVWHGTGLKKIRTSLAKSLPQLVEMSDGRVLFLIYNNIGSAPVFPKLIRFFLKRRCDRVQETIRDTAYQHKVPTIELFTTDDRNPFLGDPKTLFAFDGIHPSSEGYRLWYHRMWLIMHQNGYRF